MSGMKPCPFCGKEDLYFEQDEEGETNIVCDWCEYKTRIFQTIGDAARWWQTRPIEDALRKRIAELEEDNRSFGDSNMWLKQNYEDLERDYGVMYDKMCARIDKVTAENKVLEGAWEILREQNKRLFSQVFSNAYGKEREE